MICSADDKLDAYFADRGIIAAMLREGGRPGFEISKQYFSYETYALALPRDDGAFRLLVDRTLARLYRTGKINAILEKTFGKTPADELLKAMFVINSLPDQVSVEALAKHGQQKDGGRKPRR